MGNNISYQSINSDTSSIISDIPSIFSDTINSLKSLTVKPEYFIETTISSFNKNVDDSNFTIRCDPMPTNWRWLHLTLHRDHPDFVNIYNQIEDGKSYRIKYDIIDNEYCISKIENCNRFKTTGRVTGFLNLGNESIGLREYEEVILNGNSIKHRLIQKKQDPRTVHVGKNYTITYSKFYGGDFYIISDVVDA